MKKLAELFAVAVFIVAFAMPVFAVTDESTEVPKNSWEYDAVAQLAAKGYFTDYPGGLGEELIVRGDVASMLASALPVDMALVSKEDVEMLEMLVDEFRDELSNHGVKSIRALDDVDKRNPTWK